MKTRNVELFPLATFIVYNQMKRFGYIIENLVITDDPTSTVAGYCNHTKKEIGLNIGKLSDPVIILRYNTALEGDDEEEKKIRLGAAILFEECYHAGHLGTELNTEELATAYGRRQALKMPREILKTKKEKTKEKEENLNKTVLLLSGGMVDFINKISKKNEIVATVPCKYGSMTVMNDAHITEIEHSVDMNKLTEIKEVLGNITKAGIEYAGMIYLYEDKTWKTFIDITENEMAEVSINQPVKVSMTKEEGKDPIIQLVL